MGPRYEGMEDWVVTAIAGDGNDLSLAGYSSLEVLDAVGLGWVVRAKLGGANDYFEVGGLVQALGFAGAYAGDDALQRHVGVCSSHIACGGVVGAGCGGFDVRDGLAPVL